MKRFPSLARRFQRRRKEVNKDIDLDTATVGDFHGLVPKRGASYVGLPSMVDDRSGPIKSAK